MNYHEWMPYIVHHMSFQSDSVSGLFIFWLAVLTPFILLFLAAFFWNNYLRKIRVALLLFSFSLVFLLPVLSAVKNVCDGQFTKGCYHQFENVFITQYFFEANFDSSALNLAPGPFSAIAVWIISVAIYAYILSSVLFQNKECSAVKDHAKTGGNVYYLDFNGQSSSTLESTCYSSENQVSSSRSSAKDSHVITTKTAKLTKMFPPATGATTETGTATDPAKSVGNKTAASS